MYIIVAEDDSILSELYCETVRMAGHEAFPVYRPEDLKEQIRKRRPDGLLVDYGLVSREREAIAEGKAGELGPIRTVLLSGTLSEEKISHARKLFPGLTACLEKPFDITELEKALKTI